MRMFAVALVYYRLVGDDEQLWGATTARFGGRPGHGTVSLERAS